MSERIEFWRGFAGGLLAGVVVGAFSYLAKDTNEGRVVSLAEQIEERTNSLPLHRESAESAGDPAKLLPHAGTVASIDFERPAQPA